MTGDPSEAPPRVIDIDIPTSAKDPKPSGKWKPGKMKTKVKPVAAEVVAGQRRSSRRLQDKMIARLTKMRKLDKADRVYKAKSNHRNFPKTVEEAMRRPDWPQWKEAIRKELSSIVKKGTFRDLQSGKRAKGNPLRTMMVLTIKYHADGTIERYKARFVVLGNHQVYSESYSETYAPTASMQLVRSVISWAAQHRKKLHQLDIKTAFLNAAMDYDVDVRLDAETLSVFNELAEEMGLELLNDDTVKRLAKALYGLKQAPRQWYKEISTYLKKLGFLTHPVEECFFKRVDKKTKKRIWIVLFVDDMLIVGDDDADVEKLKAELATRYELADLGEAEKFLGMRVSYHETGIMLNLDHYTEELLERFNMNGCNPEDTPAAENLADSLYNAEMDRRDGVNGKPVDFPVREAIGALLFLGLMTRPDICNAVRELSRYVNNPTEAVVHGIKRVLRYLSGTVDLGVFYKYGGTGEVYGYCDASFACDRLGRKSVSGILIFQNEGLIDWKSKLQSIVAQSTMEAEYIALAMITNQLKVLRSIRSWFVNRAEEPYVVYEDNDACEVLVTREGSLQRAKHIDIKYHVSREAVANGEIVVKHVSTHDQLADALTKNLGPRKFVLMLSGLVCEVSDA